MLEQFQNLFVNPSDKNELKYEGTFSKNKWENGQLKSNDCNWNVINGVPYFNSDKEGDQFNQDDVDSWSKGGRFKKRWESKDNKIQVANEIYHSLCQEVASLNLPIMEIASGPGLGLVPDIVSKNQNIKCLVSDASSVLISKWHDFFIENNIESNISFASFDATNMPIRSNSIDVITSNIGFSSLRFTGSEGMMGLNDAYRVLKRGGYIFAIENEWKDRKALHEVFSLWGEKYWFNDEELSWREKFEKAGFKIAYETLQQTRFLTPEDNELGEAAARFGIDIGMEFKAYKLVKL